MNEFTFTFEELPLVVENGFEAGLVTGEATVGYYRDGEWFVREISLLGYRDREKKQVAIDHHTELYLSILDQLERGAFKDSITDKVMEALADNNVVVLSDRRQHSTHHAAYSGAV